VFGSRGCEYHDHHCDLCHEHYRCTADCRAIQQTEVA
jgi:hypothetical protein